MAISAKLLRWYDRHRRQLPWRAEPGMAADPYHVWLSEIMLQQTTVATVGPYFEAFLARWPAVEDLAAAALDDVLHAWQGLGYYARARNLHACAVRIAGDHGGRFPTTVEGLLSLPGIGAYTAAAIAAIAFGRPVAAVDGNIERVTARLFAIDDPLPGAKAAIRTAAAGLVPKRRAGDFNQAMMDLGAGICLPRRPDCSRCPLADQCRARQSGIAADLPVKAAKKEKPTRRGTAFWIRRRDGAILLRRRPERGLLGGMMEVPSTAWREQRDRPADFRESPIPLADWRPLPGLVKHTFTHFHLEISVVVGEAADDAPAPAGTVWAQPDQFAEHALPTVMKKICRHALATEENWPL